MSNCIYLKQKLNRKLECKLDKNNKIPTDCANCAFKEYKCTKFSKNCAKSNKHQINKTLQSNCRQLQSSAELKKKSSELTKLERNRFSLFTDDLEHCIICGKSPVNKHEIFFGSANRKNSMIYGLVIPLCIAEHHNQVECKGIHFNKSLCDEWHKKGQAKFTETYPDLSFEDIFKKNHLK